VFYQEVYMRCPILSELPPPPEGKSGWPWTEETPQIPEAKPGDPPWPKISIVTPSYNQGQFMEETIRSTLLQGYPNLEYIIFDGGSTDDSVEIIKKYEPWLTYWASEPDRGQSHAINKGLKRVSGEVIAYLNSDDIYLSGTLQRALSYMTDQKEVDLVYGDCCVINDESQTVSVWRSRPFDLLVELCQNFIYQPTVFMKREVFEVIGFFDEELHHTMDVDYWLRAATQTKQERACCRLPPNGKERLRNFSIQPLTPRWQSGETARFPGIIIMQEHSSTWKTSVTWHDEIFLRRSNSNRFHRRQLRRYWQYLTPTREQTFFQKQRQPKKSS
jgi:glycosyltransferase involved in cell wall biosynthesis